MKSKLAPLAVLLLFALAPMSAYAQFLTPVLREWGGSKKTTETTEVGPQANLWRIWSTRDRVHDCTTDDVQFFDSFCNFGVGSGTVYKGYGIHLDTGTTIQEIATEIGGVISFDTDGTDNDSCELTSGGNVGVLVKIPSSAGDIVIFDARWRPNQVTNTYNWFVGLTEEGCAVDDGLFTDAGASANKDQIGFRVLEADGDALEFVYKALGQTIVTTTNFKALTANTWVRTGFVFNPAWPVDSRLRVFVDNGRMTGTGATLTSTNIAAATFPSGEEMALTAGMKNQTTSAQSVDLDYWGAAQAQ